MDHLVIERARVQLRRGYCEECEEHFDDLPKSETKCPICATKLSFNAESNQRQTGATGIATVLAGQGSLGQTRLVLPSEVRPPGALQVPQSGSVGELLQGTREAARMSEIQNHILQMIESQDIDDLPAGIVGNQSHGAPPASKAAIQRLRRFKISQTASGSDAMNASGPDARGAPELFRQVSISVSGIKGKILGIPAGFGPGLPKDGIQQPITVADPLLANSSELANAAEVKHRIVLTRRGGCSFAKKAMLAQNSGAVCLVVIQNSDVFPYTMTDSKDEAKGLTIPLVMVSQETGRKLLDYLSKLKTGEEQQDKHSSGETGRSLANQTAHRRVMMAIIPTMGDTLCPICHDLFELNQTLIQLPSPCLHTYHEDCLLQWLQLRNSCPECRYQLETENEQYEVQRNMELQRQEREDLWYF